MHHTEKKEMELSTDYVLSTWIADYGAVLNTRCFLDIKHEKYGNGKTGQNRIPRMTKHKTASNDLQKWHL